jgi:nitrite reductase/ring-hydroxylating ferredoxin subunit
MDEGVRARVATDDERDATRVEASDGEVAAGGAAFSFSVGRPDVESDNADSEPESETAPEQDGSSDDAERADDPRYVAAIEDVPTNGTIRCEAFGGRRAVEFICRRDGEEAFAWRNSCPHEPDVRLDPGWGAMVRDGQIVCYERGARFETGDGLCTYGPCRGKVLDPVDVEVRENAVYLTDERFEACRRLR